jgi:8-oxo-dGTP pyrophosphatase MutT (NUDIX family)
MWEFPQGTWPQGLGGSAEDLARAELTEETGLTAASMQHLGRLVHAQGMSPTAFDVYLAEGLAEGTPRPESTEQDMEHRFVTDDELDDLLRTAEMCDAASLSALTLYRLGLGS